MAKKTKDGLILQAGKKFGDMLSSIGSDFERYKTRKARENSGNLTMQQMELLSDPMKGFKSEYRGPTAEETANMNKGFNKPEKPKTTEKSTVTPARIKKINKEKQSVTNMQNKINATDQAKFETARKKLRGGSSSMDETAKAVAEANVNLTGKSKDIDPETNVSNTKKERRQLLRARKRAGRKSSDGTYTSEQLKAERDKIVKRGAARKQYLRNFASQLARGEQAAPIRGFGEGDGNPANDATLAGASKEVATKNAETNSFAKNILSDFASIGNNNSDLLSNNIQSLGSFESEDSSPSTFMKLEYRKKRGY